MKLKENVKMDKLFILKCSFLLHGIHHKKLVLSVENVSTHTFHLAHFLHNSLRELKHSNGKNAIELYPNKFSDKECQSGIVTFNVKGANGDYIGYAQVDDLILIFYPWL